VDFSEAAETIKKLCHLMITDVDDLHALIKTVRKELDELRWPVYA